MTSRGDQVRQAAERARRAAQQAPRMTASFDVHLKIQYEMDPFGGDHLPAIEASIMRAIVDVPFVIEATRIKQFEAGKDTPDTWKKQEER